MKAAIMLLLVVVGTLDVCAQPDIVFPRFPIPHGFHCFGDSNVVALYSGGIVASTDYGDLRHAQAMLRFSSDAGRTWYRKEGIPYTLSLEVPNSVQFLDSSTIVAQAFVSMAAPGVQRGVLIRTQDGGRTWKEVLATEHMGELRFSNSLLGSYCNGDSVFWSTVDGGQSWYQCSVPRVREGEPNSYLEVLPLSPSHWIILTSSSESLTGRVKYRFRATSTNIEDVPTRFYDKNGVSSWTCDLVHFSHPGVRTIISSCFRMYERKSPQDDLTERRFEASHDDGQTWHTFTFPSTTYDKYILPFHWISNRLEPVWFTDSIGIVASEGIFRTTNGGLSWNKQLAPGAFQAACASTGFGLVKAQVLFGPDPSFPDSIRSVTYETHDYGGTWTSRDEIEGPRNISQSEIFHTRDGDVILIRYGKNVYRSIDHGYHWTAAELPSEWVRDEKSPMHTDHPILWNGENGRVHLGCYAYSDDNGLTWKRPTFVASLSPSAARMIQGKEGRLIQGIVRDSTLLWMVSTDRGITWSLVDSTAIPGMKCSILERLYIQPEDSSVGCFMMDIDSGMRWYSVQSEWPYDTWRTQSMEAPPSRRDSWPRPWTRYSVSENGETIIRVNVEDDSLVISSDRGKSWHQIRILRDPDIGILQTRNRFCQLFACPDGSIIYGDYSGLRKTTDSGTSWPSLVRNSLDGTPGKLLQDNDGSLWAIQFSTSRTFYRDPVFIRIIQGSVSSQPLFSSPFTFTLPPAWPNPASSQGAVHLPYELSSPAEVTIVIRDILGRVVARLDQGRRDVGRHEALWQPRGLGPGVYLTQVSVGSGRVAMGKVVVR